jgi:hypothetical protein
LRVGGREGNRHRHETILLAKIDGDIEGVLDGGETALQVRVDVWRGQVVDAVIGQLTCRAAKGEGEIVSGDGTVDIVGIRQRPGGPRGGVPIDRDCLPKGGKANETQENEQEALKAHKAVNSI